MTLRNRLLLFEVFATILEAVSKAMFILLESDDPPNVHRPTEKSGPQTPYGARTVTHLQRVYAEADTSIDRKRVMKLAERLASQGLINDDDISRIKG